MVAIWLQYQKKSINGEKRRKKFDNYVKDEYNNEKSAEKTRYNRLANMRAKTAKQKEK